MNVAPSTSNPELWLEATTRPTSSLLLDLNCHPSDSPYSAISRHTRGGATPNGAQVEVEALVTAVNSPSEFVIGSVRVQVQASTKFEFGTRESIVVGSRIEVEGTFDDNGVLQATKIEFDDDDAEIQGFVNAVHPFDNTIELQGFEIQINGETEFEFDEDDLSTLSLDTIQPGDFLEVEGFVGSDGVFVVTHLEREDD